VIGHSLSALGWLALFVFLAISFRSFRHTFSPLTPDPEVPGGFQGLRRSNRQINGRVPYEADDIPHLRRLAERRTSQNQGPAGLGAAISGVVAFTGLAIAPPDFPTGFDLVFRIVSVAVVAICLWAVVQVLRKGPDPKAADFLARTADESPDLSRE
jgi:hypothetical protein